MINIENPIIPSKTWWRARFGWTMTKYTFSVTTPQSGYEGQGDTYTDVRIDRHTKLTGYTCRGNGI